MFHRAKVGLPVGVTHGSSPLRIKVTSRRTSVLVLRSTAAVMARMQKVASSSVEVSVLTLPSRPAWVMRSLTRECRCWVCVSDVFSVMEKFGVFGAVLLVG